VLTFYSFSQNLQLNWSQFASATVSDFNFGAAGDWGCTSNTDATLANMNGKGPERVFGLGDYSYASTGSCFFTKIDGSGLTGKTKIAIGNHEDDDSEGFSGYMSHFSQSQTYFSYNHGDVHILVVDTDRNSYSSGSTQRNFVQNDLQSASTNPNIKWIIVYLHKPMYTSPNSCGSSSCSNTGSENTNIRNGFGPMFAQYGVDLVLQGHVHNYQRTYKLTYNPGNPASPTITDNNPNTYTEGNGGIYAIVGTGGVNFHALSGKAAFTSSQQDDFFGQLDIQSTNNGNTLQGKFYRNGNNDILDSFSITKVGNLPPIANDQTVSVIKDTPTPMNLTATDPANDTLTYSIVTQPSHGTISTGTGASRTYTPDAGYVGTDSFTFKANDGTVDSNTATVTINVIEPGQGTYNYAPGLVLTGSNYNDTPSSPSLQLFQFSVAAWFKTSTNFGSNAFIVNKGGFGSDSSGQNLNYGIWMNSLEQIKAGFETSSGADQFVTSTNTYSDGAWHYAVVTNDGSTIRLYIDGVQVATKSTSGTSPESSGTKPVRVGANSRVTPPGDFFTGEVDEVRVWNDDLTAQQAADAFAGSAFNTVDQVLHLPFGTNSPPVANAGSDKIVEEGTMDVVLDGSGSSDSDGLITSYLWAQTEGPVVAQNSTNTAAVGFDAPIVTNDTLLKFNLTVTDNGGATSSDVVAVTITDANQAPIANAGPDQSVNESTIVTLDGSASNDPDGDLPLSYLWTQTAGAHNITLIGANTANATFTAPNVSSSGDLLIFSLNVTDAKGLASSSPLDSVSVTVNDNPQLNNPPQTLDQTVSTNRNAAVEIALTGTDSDGDTLSFITVTQPGFGSLGPITATGPNSANVTYTPDSDYVGQDSFQFKVNDGIVDSSSLGVVSISILEPSSTTLTLDPVSNVPWSKAVTVTGKLIDNVGGNVGIGGKTVSFDGSGAANLQSVVTSSDGTFSATGAAPQTVGSGWTVQAHFAGDGSYNPSMTSATYNTLKHDTSLSISLSPSRLKGGAAYSVIGKLTDITNVPSSALSGKIISFTATSPIIISNKITDAIGQYSATGLTAPNTKASYTIQSHFAGDSLYGLKDSPTVILQVIGKGTSTSTASALQNRTGPSSTTSSEKLTNDTSLPSENLVVQNIVPVANAEADQTASANTEVTLDGTKSNDEDGNLVSYKWEQTDGPKVDIKDSDQAKATFNAPSLSEDSKLVFKLTVIDEQDASDSDDVAIEVKSDSEPESNEVESNTESESN